LVIAGYTLAWFWRSEPGPPHPLSFSTGQRLLAFAVAGAAAATGSAWGMLVRHATSVEHGLFNAVTAGMAAAAITIVLLCIGWQVCANKRT
jgi:hypothetical protein